MNAALLGICASPRRGVTRSGMAPLVLPNVGLMDQVSPFPAFLHGNEDDEEVVIRKRNGFGFEEDQSSESSSIGAASSSSSSRREEEEEEEVQSKRRVGALGSLDSLEDSLPIKRGLSNFFSGKSKSFASLSEVAMAGSSAKDIAKQENPFNKRRRLVMISKMRRASYSSLLCPPLPPLLSPSHTVEEADEEGGDEEEDRYADSSLASPFPLHDSDNVIKKKPFRSPRSFSLSDLQHV